MDSEEYTHLGDCLRGAILDRDEPTLRALMSNNINTVIAALDEAAALRQRAADLEEICAHIKTFGKSSASGWALSVLYDATEKHAQSVRRATSEKLRANATP